MAREERDTSNPGELAAAAVVARVDHLLDRAIDSLRRARRESTVGNKVGGMRTAMAHVSNAFTFYEATEGGRL